MPTLSLEKNPPQLSVCGSPHHKLPKKRHDHVWYVGCIKSRQEKRFAFSLLERGISYYLPLESYTAISARQEITAQRLLFPGYIFFYTTPERLVDLPLSSKQAMYSYIAVLNSAERQLREELKSLLLTAQGNQAKFYAPLDLSVFTPDSRIRFTEGAMKDTEGTILTRRDQPSTGSIMLQLKISMLGSAIFEVHLTPQDRYVKVIDKEE